MKTRTGRKEQENKLVLVLIFLLFLVIIINFFMIKEQYKILEIEKFYASIIVSNKVGFDLNSTALTFGEVMPGGSSSRSIIWENVYNFPVEVVIYGDSTMKKFVIPVKYNLGVGERKAMAVSASVSRNQGFGEYRGNVIVIIKKIK